jgi:hypothetical protein
MWHEPLDHRALVACLLLSPRGDGNSRLDIRGSLDSRGGLSLLTRLLGRGCSLPCGLCCLASLIRRT